MVDKLLTRVDPFFGTACAAPQGKKGAPDEILTSRKILSMGSYRLCPSDHLPVVAELWCDDDDGGDGERAD